MKGHRLKTLFVAAALLLGTLSCGGEPFFLIGIAISKAEPDGALYEQANMVNVDLVSACALPNSLNGYDRYQDTGPVWNGIFAARTITLTFCRARVAVGPSTVDAGPSDGFDALELEGELAGRLDTTLVYDSAADPPASADPADAAVVDLVVTNDPQRNPGLLPAAGYCFIIDEVVRRAATAGDPPGCAP